MRNLIKKYSVGVACVRFRGADAVNGGRPEILMVCKRYTYAFSEFIHGKYPQSDFRKNKPARAILMSLFNKMTVEEKLDILSLDFDQMWYRVWLNGPRPAIYYLSKNKFESTFLLDGGIKLRKMISRSRHAHLIWEIPKGRKRSRSESDINCAIREFAEETNISKKAYKLLPNIKRSYSFIDDGVQYHNTYYVAVAKHDVQISIDINSREQINEIHDIRWMDVDAIRYVDDSGMLMNFIRPIFKMIKKYPI